MSALIRTHNLRFWGHENYTSFSPQAAEGLAEEFQVENCPILVDFMEDQANNNYGALPERLYIILDGKFEYIGDPGPKGYKVNEVDDWLNNFRNQKLKQ